MVAHLRTGTVLAAVLGTLLLAFAACGGSSGSRGTTVTVTLSDFKIAASQTTFKTGTSYHFVVTNSSKSSTNHELLIIMPMSGEGMTMDDMHKSALHYVDESKLPPGATQSFDYTFKDPASAGQLELACHVGSHYQLGMHTPVTVTH